MCKKHCSNSPTVHDAARQYAKKSIPPAPMLRMAVEIAFKDGAEWQAEQQFNHILRENKDVLKRLKMNDYDYPSTVNDLMKWLAEFPADAKIVVGNDLGCKLTRESLFLDKARNWLVFSL